MTHSLLFWTLATLLCIVTQSFYSMMEMACVSFNRIRLQYHVNEGEKRAQWLSALLSSPAHLFGTTLLGVNIALQVGSECSRQVYSALNLPPDLAPLTQVLMVLIFAELAPMFAARRHPEHVAMAGVPLIYASSKLFLPAIWFFGLLSRLVNFALGNGRPTTHFQISREELQTAFSEDEDGSRRKTEDFNTVVDNIFSLREKTASQVMEPLSAITMVPSNCTVGRLRQVLKAFPNTVFLPIYHRTRRNIVGIAFPRDLVRIPDEQPVLRHARSPWFVTRHSRIFRILKQFRQNNQSAAVVLSDKGNAIGLLALDDILSEIFGEINVEPLKVPLAPHHRFIERSFPGEMLLIDFNAQFDAHLEGEKAGTLYEVMVNSLGHDPAEGEFVRVGDYELTMTENPLIGPKTVSVRTIVT